MKKTFKISFIAFWPNFNVNDNVFINFLKTLYDIKIIDSNELSWSNKNDIDLLIYSCFYPNNSIKKLIALSPYKTLYYSGENDFPDFNICDYAITQNRLDFDKRHLYIPFWFFNSLKVDENGEFHNDLNTSGSNDNNLVKREFCSFVVSNNNCAIPIRTKIYEELSKYKPIASGGRYLNNTGRYIDNKQEFISNYKFNIASENSIVNGYITEKITDAFNANTIPIYAGPEDVIKDFNQDAFINLGGIRTFDELIERIKELDNDDKKYMKMLSAPKYIPGIISYYQIKLKEFLTFVTYDYRKFNHKYGRIGLINSRI